jgi:hypothetical protein
MMLGTSEAKLRKYLGKMGADTGLVPIPTIISTLLRAMVAVRI